MENMTVKQVFRRLERVLNREKLLDEGLSCMPMWHETGDKPFYGLLPNWRWIACFAVTGDSEGWYVHVEFVANHPDARRLVFLAKTFQGMEHAYKIARRCAELLGA